MPTYAEITGKLLNDAAIFFRNLARDNESMREQMTENATIFEQVGQLVVHDPSGVLNGTTHAELASRLMKDSANFFRTLAEENEPIREQMLENADAYEQVGILVQQSPTAEMPEE